MPAKKTKQATAVVPTPAAMAPAETKLAEPVAAPASGEAPAEATPTQPAAEQKEKKPRPPPKIITGSSVSETRVRKALSNSMGPEVSHAVFELKLLKDKENKPVPKKFGELSDATVIVILAHKPKAPTEEELKSMKDEQKKQLELRNTLFALLQQPRSTWAERPLLQEDAKVLRRMVKQDSIRTGDDAINTFTATANYVVRDLALAGLRNLKSDEKRVMKLPHVIEDITSLESWPLLKELRCVAAAKSDHVKRLQDAAQKLLDKKEKQKKKKAEKAAAGAAPVAPAQPATETKSAEPVVSGVQSAVEEVAAVLKRTKTPEADFEHHSQNIVREVCQSQNVTCEISGEVKHFCSLVVYELVCLYGDLIQNQTGYADVKTIKANTITSITNFILTYTRSKAPGLLKYVDDWLVKLAEEEKKAKEEKSKKAAEAAAVAATAAASVTTAGDTQPVASQPQTDSAPTPVAAS